MTKIGRPIIFRACGYCMEIKASAQFLTKMCKDCYGQGRHIAKRYRGTPCKVQDCPNRVGRHSTMKRLCKPHLYRLKRYGRIDSGRAVRIQGAKTGRTLTHQGYVKHYLGPSKWVFEHRVVMERRLGRKLLPTESVHHKNGDRADNRDSNLELWSRSQPSGQRVEDKLAWAYEIIALYGEAQGRTA